MFKTKTSASLFKERFLWVHRRTAASTFFRTSDKFISSCRPGQNQEPCILTGPAVRPTEVNGKRSFLAASQLTYRSWFWSLSPCQACILLCWLYRFWWCSSRAQTHVQHRRNTCPRGYHRTRWFHEEPNSPSAREGNVPTQVHKSTKTDNPGV